MRIIYIHQYFKTPEEGGAVRSYHLAKGLVEAGHEVEMITGSDKITYDQRWIDGIKVHYLPVDYKQEFGFIRRIISFFKFVKQSKRLLKKLKNPDVFYITSTPLTTGWIGLWAKRKKAIPYIFEVRDLWPRAPIEVGAISNPFIKRRLVSLEKRIYEQALSIVALSPGIANHIRKIVPEQKIHLIPNFGDLDAFYPMNKNHTLRQKYGLTDAMTIAYTGALGEVNAVDELLNLAELSAERGKDWQYLIMGEGSQADNLKKRVLQNGLTNVRFIPFGSKNKVNEVLGLADFAWISFAAFPVLRTNSPNKFFDALASGKGIIVNHKGWLYDLVTTHDIGVSFLDSKLEDSFDRFDKLVSNPIKVQQYGINSRKLAEEFFNKEYAITKLLAVFEGKNKNDAAGEEMHILRG